MIREKQPKRFVYLDTQTHQVVFKSNIKNINKAEKIVAEHYKYLRCTKGALCKMFDIIGVAKAKVFSWILNHTSLRRNIVLGSQRSIANRIGVTLTTFHNVIRKLKKNRLIIAKTGYFIVSPALFFYGSDKKFLYQMRLFQTELANPKNANRNKVHSNKLGFEEIKLRKMKLLKHRIHEHKEQQNNDKHELQILAEQQDNRLI